VLSGYRLLERRKDRPADTMSAGTVIDAHGEH